MTFYDKLAKPPQKRTIIFFSPMRPWTGFFWLRLFGNVNMKICAFSI